MRYCFVIVVIKIQNKVQSKVNVAQALNKL